MKRLTTTLLCLFVISTMGVSQETRFYMPREFRQAYKNKTRDYNGNPGNNYWQNTANYVIEAKVDPDKHIVEGVENVTYENNSPNEINDLLIRLYNNVYQKGQPKATAIDSADVGKGIQIKTLLIDGQKYDLNDPEEAQYLGTNLQIHLKRPLMPTQRITVTAEWSTFIPKTNKRAGLSEDGAIFVAYWYPQIAAFDDVFGWDQLNYNLQNEFYNALANYDVKVTLPKAYTMWSTGFFLNPGEIMKPEILEKFIEANKSQEAVTIVSQEDIKNNFEHKGGTWHFKADEVPDYAFAISDHHIWEAAQQRINEKPVILNLAYPATQAEAYKGVLGVQRAAMKLFSEDVPGIAYPYPTFNTFVGLEEGSMEFPMMANSSGPDTAMAIRDLFHSYMPGYVRINQKRFAWMDEGWADFMTSLTIRRLSGEEEALPFAGFKSRMEKHLGTFIDLPLITSSQFMDASNYDYAACTLPSFFFAILNHQLGDELFFEALKEFITQWASKSPTPYDMMYTFERVVDKDLSWLFQPWLFEYGAPDLAISNYKKGKIEVINHGRRPIPLKIVVTMEDGSTQTIIKKASIWKNGNIFETKLDNHKEIRYVTVNADLPDASDYDNFYPSIAEIYSNYSVPEGVKGQYKIKEMPMKASIGKKDAALYLDLNGLQTFLIPINETQYKSIDEQVKVHFKMKEGNCEGIDLEMDGYKLTSVKL